MKKTRKLTSLMLAGLLAAGTLAGCTNEPSSTADAGGAASGTGQEAGASNDGSSGDQVTLRFMWWGGDARNEATLAVIDQYQKLHPNVKIEAEMNSDQGYVDKVSTMLANGTAPDIMQQNVDSLPDFVSRGDFFVDFYEYPDLFDSSSFDQNFIDQFGTFDGKLLALPTGMSCLSTLANTEAAKACGVDLDKQITWQSMYEDGKALHEANPEYYYLNVDTKLLCEYVLRPYLRQLTGESFIIDSEKKMSFTRDQLIEVLQYIKACYDDGVFEPAEDSATFKQQIHTNPKWIDGKFVFAFGPSSNINLLMGAVPETECTVVQMPMAENRVNDGFFADTPQYMTVNKASAHVEEAIDFMNYFYNNTEAQETLKDVRSVPPTSAARELCAEKGYLDPVVVQAVDLAAGLNGKSDKGYTTSAEVYAIQEDMLESIAYGQSTPEEAADNAIELIDDYLSSVN